MILAEWHVRREVNNTVARMKLTLVGVKGVDNQRKKLVDISREGIAFRIRGTL
jgi:hypothetical protein